MPALAPRGGVLERLQGPWRLLVKEITAFGLVSILAFTTQIALLYVLLRLGVGPLTANAVSVALATVVAYVGNRNYSFSHRAASGLAREATIFMVVNAIAFALSEVMVAIAAYSLGYKNRPHVIVAVTVASMALCTVFRFWCYKRFVFLKPQTDPSRRCWR